MPKVDGSVSLAPPPPKPRLLRAGDLFRIDDGPVRLCTGLFYAGFGQGFKIRASEQGWFEVANDLGMARDGGLDTELIPHPHDFEVVGKCSKVMWWEKQNGNDGDVPD